MYNEDLKIRFIREYTQNISKAQHVVGIFSAFEPYERNYWHADLCTRSGKDLQPVIDKLTGLRYNSHWAVIPVLKEYVKWCIDNQVPNACNGILEVNVVGLERVRTCMVSGPLHLQRFMDSILDKECEETVHNLYRCYYWMAFSGLYEEDAFCIIDKDVQIDSLTIKYNGYDYPVYREAISAFKNAITLTGFYYKHPKYSEIIWRERAAGHILLRGFRGNIKPLTLRSVFSNINTNALKDKKTEQQLSYSRVWLSGLFYRTYEREHAGYSVSFTDAAIKQMGDKEYKNEKYQLAKIIRQYQRDYQRWKQVFYS